jgi:uncharacterized DUF497 family protein
MGNVAGTMEFDWSLYKEGPLSPEEVAESFEDSFSLRLLPDSNRFASLNRFFSLGASSGGKGIFAIYTSTGKVIRVVMARLMTDEEIYFYERKSQESN